MRLDELDIAILRAMGVMASWYPQGRDDLKPQTIARKVGTSAQTVKDRVRAMEEQGTIERYMLGPNPALVGRTFAALLCNAPEERKRKTLEGIEGSDYLAGYLDFHGPWFYASVPHKGDADLARIKQALHEAGARVVGSPYRHNPPPPATPPTLLDFKILLALMFDARRSLAEVAEEVGATARTVKTRIDRMEREQLVTARPVIDRGNLPGWIFVHLLVQTRPGQEEEAHAAVIDKLRARLLFDTVPAGHRAELFDVGLVARTMTDVENIRLATAGLPGVENVLPLLPQGGYDNFELMQGMFSEAMQAAAARQGRPVDFQNRKRGLQHE